MEQLYVPPVQQVQCNQRLLPHRVLIALLVLLWPRRQHRYVIHVKLDVLRMQRLHRIALIAPLVMSNLVQECLIALFVWLVHLHRLRNRYRAALALRVRRPEQTRRPFAPRAYRVMLSLHYRQPLA